MPDEAAAKSLDTVSRGILNELTPHLQNASWTKAELEPILNDAAAENGIGFGKLAAPLRAALAGRTATRMMQPARRARGPARGHSAG